MIEACRFIHNCADADFAAALAIVNDESRTKVVAPLINPPFLPCIDTTLADGSMDGPNCPQTLIISTVMTLVTPADMRTLIGS
jgi:hypothetical protein